MPLEDLSPVADVDDETTAAYQKAITLLANHCPIYLPWVLRALCYVIPLHPANVRSGSVGDQFGVIAVSLGQDTMVLGESFVHEASHQYLNLLCRLGPIDDGTDTNLYYSPARQTERPLGKIVTAYHAFANMLQFYRMCRSNGLVGEGDYSQREAELVSQVDQLETPLRSNSALTLIGRSLCDPLIERLNG